MIDSKLEELYKFNDTKHISRTLMLEFNEKLYDHYGISKPSDAPLLTEYTISIIDTNPNTGVDTIIKYDQTIGKFIKTRINDNFDKLILDYYNTIRYESDPVKKAAYYKLIYNQLNELYRLLKQHESLTTYLIFFKNGIDLFKKKFGFTTVQRATYQKQLENSFEILITNKTSQDFIIYKLERIFNKLKLNDFLPLSTENKDFLELFSGNIIEKPIMWSGTLSSFYYFIKKLNKLQFIKDLKGNKWGVANKCFYILNNDGVVFESYKFRSQKNPSPKVMSIIDQILSL